MSRRRGAQPVEPIAHLFGDVVREGPAVLYGTEDAAAARDALDGPAPAEPATPPLPQDPAPDLAPGPPARPAVAGAQPPPRPAPSAEHRAAGPVWRDDRGLLSGVVILYGLITALTFGFGRFWLKSAQRGVLWSHVSLEREPLEWTGRGAEMFAGFVVAVLALAATLGAAQMGAAFAGVSLSGDPQVAAVLQWGLIGGLALPPLWLCAAFRARAYRLSRTRWKGVRFGMRGSGLGLVGLWLLWAPGVALSLGLAWPFWRWAREGHLTRRMHWGEARFRFEGGPWRLFCHWLPLWGLAAGLVALAFAPGARAALGPLAPEAIAARGPLAMAAALMAGGALTWVLWLNWRAAEIREGWRARRLEGARAECDFSCWHLVDAHMQVGKRNLWPGLLVYALIGAVVVIVGRTAFDAEMVDPAAEGLLGGLAEGIEAMLFEGLRTWRGQGLVLMALAINYVASFVFLQWLWLAIHAGRVQRHLVESLRFSGLETLDEVPQAAHRRAAEAEGMADALDVAL